MTSIPPKSSSPGEDLFLMEYFTKYQKVSHQEAQLIWARQSPQTKAKYEKQAQTNLKYFKRKRSDSSDYDNETENPYELS
jgi:hypothetical protein